MNIAQIQYNLKGDYDNVLFMKSHTDRYTKQQIATAELFLSSNIRRFNNILVDSVING